MLFFIQHSKLTMTVTSSKESVGEVEVNQLIVTVFPGCFDMFRLEVIGVDSGKINCFAADQTARNKWLAVFRRMGVAIQEGDLACTY